MGLGFGLCRPLLVGNARQASASVVFFFGGRCYLKTVLVWMRIFLIKETHFLRNLRIRVDLAQKVFYLDVLNELLRRRVDGSFGVDDVLDGVGPARGLVQQLTVEAVRMFPAVHDHVPVTCQEDTKKNRR